MFDVYTLQDLREDLRSKTVPVDALEGNRFVSQFLVRLHDVIWTAQRAPDDWEVTHVLAAVGALHSSWNQYAAMSAERAMAPPSERPEPWRTLPSHVTLMQLAEAIDGADRSLKVPAPGRRCAE